MMFFNSSANDLADLHCHIVPFVDDGAEDLEEAKKIIEEEYAQGVRHIAMTVHLRYGMFDTPVEQVKRHYNTLKKWIAGSNMNDMEVHLSREYYCDERFEALIDGYIANQDEVVYENRRYNPREEIIPFGKHNCILLEFSSGRMQSDEFEIFIEKASQAGLTPILAHVERYPAVQERPTIVYKMRKLGAYIQVNCEPLLAKSKSRECETAHALVQNEMVDIVSSDVHDLEMREPNLKKCYSLLKRKYGKRTADKLLRDNALALVHGVQ